MSKDTGPEGATPVILGTTPRAIHYCEGLGCLAAVFSAPGEPPPAEALASGEWTQAAGKLWCAMHREEGETRALGRCDECGLPEGEHRTSCLRGYPVTRPALAPQGLPFQWWRAAAVSLDREMEAARARGVRLVSQLAGASSERDALRARVATLSGALGRAETQRQALHDWNQQQPVPVGLWGDGITHFEALGSALREGFAALSPPASPVGGFKRGDLAILGGPASTPAERLLRRVARFALGDAARGMDFDTMRVALLLALQRKWRLEALVPFIQAELEKAQEAEEAALARCEEMDARWEKAAAETQEARLAETKAVARAEQAERDLGHSRTATGKALTEERARSSALQHRVALAVQAYDARYTTGTMSEEAERGASLVDCMENLRAALSPPRAANSPAVPDGSPALVGEGGTDCGAKKPKTRSCNIHNDCDSDSGPCCNDPMCSDHQ